jgi:hypothetical protein
MAVLMAGFLHDDESPSGSVVMQITNRELGNQNASDEEADLSIVSPI